MAEHPKKTFPGSEENSLSYAIFRQARIGLGIADLEGNLLDGNDAILKSGGYTREDIPKINNVGTLYVKPEERARALSLAKKQGYLTRFPCLFKRKDGSEYQTLLSLQSIFHGGKKYWLATVEDLSAANYP